jgi:hypothetical protein
MKVYEHLNQLVRRLLLMNRDCESMRFAIGQLRVNEFRFQYPRKRIHERRFMWCVIDV